MVETLSVSRVEGADGSIDGGTEGELACVVLGIEVVIGIALWEDVKLVVLVKVSCATLVGTSKSGALTIGVLTTAVEVVAGVDTNIEDVENVVEMDVDVELVVVVVEVVEDDVDDVVVVVVGDDDDDAAASPFGTAVHFFPPILVIEKVDIVTQTRTGDSSRRNRKLRFYVRRSRRSEGDSGSREKR